MSSHNLPLFRKRMVFKEQWIFEPFLHWIPQQTLSHGIDQGKGARLQVFLPQDSLHRFDQLAVLPFTRLDFRVLYGKYPVQHGQNQSQRQNQESAQTNAGGTQKSDADTPGRYGFVPGRA